MLGRKSVLFFISDIFGSIISMVSLFFIANRMGPEPIGIIQTITAFFIVLQFVANLGFSGAYLQMVPAKKYPIANQHGTLILLKIIFAFVHIGLCYLLVFITGSIHDFPIHIFIIISITTFFGNINLIFYKAFAAKGETAKQKIPVLLSNISKSVGRISSSFIYPKTISLAISDLLGTIIGIIIGLNFFLKYKISLPSVKIIKDYFVFGLPLLFSNFINKMIENLDKLILKFLTDFTKVGIYSSGYSILKPFSFATSAIFLILIPAFTKKSVKGDISSINKSAVKAEKFLLMFSIPFLAFLMWGMSPLSNIFFGNKFSGSGIENTIIFLGLALSVRLITSPYSNQLIAIGKPKLYLVPLIVIIIINTILDFILIPNYFFGIKMFNLGPLGAAIASFIAYLIGTIISRIITYIITKSRSDLKNIKQIISIPFILFLAFILKHYLLFLGSIINIVLSIIYSIFFYLLINLLILKTINKKDIIYLFDSINIKKIGSYIKKELFNKS